MSRVVPLTLREFVGLLEVAQLIHQQKDEPIPEIGPSNRERVESCLQMPFQVVFGATLYRGFLRKAAALFYFFAKGHPLGNGNKRMACIALAYFCSKNGRKLRMSPEDLKALALRTANSQTGETETTIAMIVTAIEPAIVEVRNKY